MNCVNLLLPKTPPQAYPINFSKVYDQYAAALFGIIVRHIGNRQAAEDILCSAFHKIHKGLSSYRREKGSLFISMLGIVRKEIETFHQTSSNYVSADG